MAKIQIGKIQPNQIQIGDYADITINNKIYRYYVIIIGISGISISTMDDSDEIHLLTINENGDYQLVGRNEIYTANFIKNATETKYWERDFTAAFTKIIFTSQKSGIYKNFTQLKNGIILYGFEKFPKNGIHLSFIDPSNIREKSSMYIEKNKVDLEMATTFVEMKIRKKNGLNYEIINYGKDDYNDEIFVIKYAKDNYSDSIYKLNLNDLTPTVYDNTTQYKWIHALQKRKFLYALNNNENLYIFDLITKRRITINAPLANMMHFNKIYQLSNEDIILQIPFDNGDDEFYHINISDGSFVKTPKSPDYWIITILLNDEILLWNIKTKMIQVWDYLNNQFTDIISNIKSFRAIVIDSVVLQNGDILFHIVEDFYLYCYRDREIINLPLLSNEYTKNREESSDLEYNFKVLQNGNLIINNGSNLMIMEFPINHKKYFDDISSSLTMLSPDIRNLIRSYL